MSPLRSGDPQRLGGYRLLGRLGEGGMGWVFLGETGAGTQVAVKVVRPELASDPAFRARFRSEVRRARQVPPFCTAEVIDADADHDPPYMVVEYVPGSTLADIVLERGPLSAGDLHSLAIGVTVALVAIHDAGVVHRDLKPANVLFALGAPKVIDFGVAKARDNNDHQTEPGQVFGTVAYMGPERLLGPATEHADTAGDIFAWGAVVVYAATGCVPFEPDTLIGAAAGVPLPAPDLAGLPGPLRGLVRQALDEDPRRRPSAHELLEQLIKTGAPADPAGRAAQPAIQRAASAVRNTAAMPEPPAGAGEPAIRTGRSRRRTLAVAAALLVAAAVAVPVIQHVASAGASTSATAQPSLGSQADDNASRADDKASRADRGDRCTLDGPLDLPAGHPAAFTCPASRVAGDRDIRARLALTAPGACAAIRTQVTDQDAYRVTICADRVTLESAEGSHVRTVAMSALDPSASAAAWHQIEIRTAGPGITVTRDGETILSRPRLTPPARGAVSLGSVPDPAHPATASQVTYADVVIAST